MLLVTGARQVGKTMILAVKEMTIAKLHDFGILCMVGRNSYPTHAFDLLTDNTNKAAKIQCALFKGKTRDIFIDRKEFTGPIYEQVDEAYHFVLRHIDMGARIDGEYRKDVYELPIFAVRESIAVAEAFHYMHIVEAWGTGIPRIINRCNEYGLLAPIFEEFGDGFKVTLFRKISNAPEKVSNAPEEVSNTFDNYMLLLKNTDATDTFINNIRVVYEYCDKGTPFGQADVMKWLKCSKSKATNIMNVLKQAHAIEKVRGFGAGKYRFVDLYSLEEI